MTPPILVESAPPAAVTEQSRRIPELDGLRGIAITAILILHSYVRVPTSADGAWQDVTRRLFSLGYAGVDLFFVLSGFLIGRILLEQRDSPRLFSVFYVRRFFRIGPVYTLLLASFFVARASPSFRAMNLGTYFDSAVPLWNYFFLVQNIGMSALRDFGPYWLIPTWSLAVEEQFYLLSPFVVRLTSPRALAIVAVVVALLCPVIRWVAVANGNGLAAIFLLPARADALLFGVLVALAFRSEVARRWLTAQRRLLTGVAGALGAILLVLAFADLGAASSIMAGFGYSVIGLFCAVLLALVLVQPAAPVFSFLRFRPLQALGRVSYFVYLFHTPLLLTLHWQLAGHAPLHHSLRQVAITLLSLVLTFVLAALSWRWIEQPALRLGHRFRYNANPA